MSFERVPFLSRFGRIFVQRQVRPTGRVVAEVLAKDPAQVSLIEHDDVIQTIPANRTDHAFDERILPRRSGRCNHFLDSQALDPSLHGVTIDAISLPQQIAWCGIKRKRFHDLLGCPLSGGMRCHVEVHDSATLVAQNNEDLEHAEGGGWDRKEVNRDEV